MDIEFGSITPVNDDMAVCVEVTIYTNDMNVENISFYLRFSVTPETTLADIKREAKANALKQMEKAIQWLSSN
ncbi:MULTISPECIES: hypothetical protein [Yersinia]|uniref:hypothetical protein n=1 Tax=Yersinia TaxID=629 RepID=UPI0005E0A7CC|nr:hypothetical protein [Yersinia intermedia]EKN3486835.1 hypothetical protein [Yersinia enterocolitica]EKN3579992.1 hypothetical protein [Yersinia enterocolitica]EKN3597271.1 hypothetical protein [Yersinia enterocolitica]EKN4068062.1 hypothetical protein [Yersinia enterocolitica]EKN4818979.1 hypothetical protein [Yersinia enterocolitica]